MTVSLTIEDVRVTLGRNLVLDGIDLEVQAGEFVTLLGASGSGKSTLLNVIAGLQHVDSGKVRFDGIDVESRPPQKRGVGVVFQSYALFGHMSVRDNVAFPLRAAGRPRGERARAAEAMLALVQLSAMADRSPDQLSGGQRQRVALARALAAEPAMLLLDEPMAALDKQLREQMQVEIRRIQQQVGITTVAVTHDQTEALTMSDRVAIMRDGVLVQVDTPERLYRRPKDRYVATFLGEANLVAIDAGAVTPASDTGQVAVIRPQDLRVQRHDELDGPWTIESVVKMVSFQGDRFRVETQTPGGGVLIATFSSNADMSAVRPGSLVRLCCVDPSLVHVLPDETPGQPGRIAEQAGSTFV